MLLLKEAGIKMKDMKCTVPPWNMTLVSRNQQFDHIHLLALLALSLGLISGSLTLVDILLPAFGFQFLNAHTHLVISKPHNSPGLC